MFKNDIWEVINGNGEKPKNFFYLVARYLFGKPFEEVKEIVEQLENKYQKILNSIDITNVDKDLIEVIKSAEDEFKAEIEPLLRELKVIKSGKVCKNNSREISGFREGS